MRLWLSTVVFATFLSSGIGAPSRALTDDSAARPDPQSLLHDLSSDEPAALLPDQQGKQQPSAPSPSRHFLPAGMYLSRLSTGAPLSPTERTHLPPPVAVASHGSRAPPVG